MKNYGKRIDISTLSNSVKLKNTSVFGAENPIADDAETSIFTWLEVSEVHRSRNGIYQKNGALQSLLTDLGKISKCYPDIRSSDGNTLVYTGAGRRGNQKLDIYNRALMDAIHTRLEVPLFCKLKANRWIFLGQWRVVDSEYVYDNDNKRMVWRFLLRKVDSREAGSGSRYSGVDCQESC